MKWKQAYATGNAEIDEQHKSLFSFSEEFRDVLDNGFGEKTYDLFLEFLAEYSKFHFEFEEECMLAHKCPAACNNKDEHALFTKVVAKEIETFENLGFDRGRAFALLDKIDTWLDSHICRIDVQLKECIERA
jgi:hemerythrin